MKKVPKEVAVLGAMLVVTAVFQWVMLSSRSSAVRYLSSIK